MLPLSVREISLSHVRAAHVKPQRTVFFCKPASGCETKHGFVATTSPGFLSSASTTVVPCERNPAPLQLTCAALQGCTCWRL
jgi:hypothetical protein